MIVPVDSISSIKENEKITIYADAVPADASATFLASNHIVVVQTAFSYSVPHVRTTLQEISSNVPNENTSMNVINIDQEEFEYPTHHCCTNSVFCIHKYFFMIVLCFMCVVIVILLYFARAPST